jgi:hypothetical protein
VRDFNAFLRYAMADDAGVANPLAGDVQRIYTYVVSQPGVSSTISGGWDSTRRRTAISSSTEW